MIRTDPPTSSATSLLSGELMAKLDRLDLLSRKMLAGKMQGDRRSKKKGRSVEFADYRPYVAGDDLRFIDWNLYARLDRLFLRLFLEEEDLCLSILLDVSPSMDYGQPNKLTYARQLAAALGYIGLVHMNRVSLYRFDSSIVDRLPNQRGRRPVARMIDYLQMQKPAPAPGGKPSSGDLRQSLKRFTLEQTGKGVVVILSDFLDKGDFASSLKCLNHDRFDVYAIQILSPQEVEPEKHGFDGDLKLTDIEDGHEAEVSIGPALLKRYRANLQAYQQHLHQQSARRGVTFIQGLSSLPVDRMVLGYLRKRGMLA